MFGDGCRKRYDVVLGDFFDFLDACDIEGAALPDIARALLAIDKPEVLETNIQRLLRELVPYPDAHGRR